MANLEIQLNTSIIKKVKSQNFQVDQIGSVLFILFALYEDRIDLLDEFDDFNRQKRAFILYTELQNRDLIEVNSEAEKDSPHYVLTKAGIEFVEYIKAEFAQTHQQVDSAKIAVAGIEEDQLGKVVSPDSLEGWIDEWIDIFPRGLKSGGRLVRGDRISCLRKMKVFMKEYPYDKSTILKATQKYIDSKRAEGFQYTRCAVYFIYRVESSQKDKMSDLAAWCDQVLHEQAEGSSESSNNLEIMA
jgi:hypothetical protein